MDPISMENHTEGIRAGKDLSLESPLLNLILAASLLSRFTSKATKTAPMATMPTIMTPPVRFVSALYDNQIPQWPMESPTRHQYKFHASLNAQQAINPINYHFVHKPDLAPSLEAGEGTKPQMPEVAPMEVSSPEDKNITGMMNGIALEKDAIASNPPVQVQEDAPFTVPKGLTKELQEFLTSLFRRNLTVQLQDEIPLNSETGNTTNFAETANSGMFNPASENSEDISPSELETETTILDIPINSEPVTEYFPVYFETTVVPDSEAAESSVDLQAEEAVLRRTKVPQDYVFQTSEYDEDEDDNDSLEEPKPPKLTQKNQRLRTTSHVRNSVGSRRTSLRPKTEPARINSKKPVPKTKKRTTPIALIYDEEDEQEESKAPPKRRTVGVANKRPPLRRTTPYRKDYDFEDDEAFDSGFKRRTASKKKPRPATTTPSYDYYDQNTHLSDKAHGNDYYDSVQEQEDNQYADDEVEKEQEDRQKSTRRPTRRPVLRQEDVTATETDFTVTDTDTTLLSTTVMPSTTTEAKTTNGEYPYYGGDHYHNISITYGPPVHHYPGYGPSNGNEHVSFTYAPPSGPSAASNPMLDTWYNQYAKASVYKRIQDLLTPNNYYNQYDVNYNDGSL